MPSAFASITNGRFSTFGICMTLLSTVVPNYFVHTFGCLHLFQRVCQNSLERLFRNSSNSLEELGYLDTEGLGLDNRHFGTRGMILRRDICHSSLSLDSILMPPDFNTDIFTPSLVIHHEYSQILWLLAASYDPLAMIS